MPKFIIDINIINDAPTQEDYIDFIKENLTFANTLVLIEPYESDDLKIPELPNEPVVNIRYSTLETVAMLLHESLHPMIEYRKDPLDACNLAHEEKNKLIEKVMSLLPLWVLED